MSFAESEAGDWRKVVEHSKKARALWDTEKHVGQGCSWVWRPWAYGGNICLTSEWAIDSRL